MNFDKRGFKKQQALETILEMKKFYLISLVENKKVLEKELEKWTRKSIELLFRFNGYSQLYFDVMGEIEEIKVQIKKINDKIEMVKTMFLLEV